MLQQTTYKNSIIETKQIYESFKFTLYQFNTTSKLNAINVAVKFSLFRSCILNLLSNFELSLFFYINKMLLLPLFLPNEFLLRNNDSNAKVNVNKLYIYFFNNFFIFRFKRKFINGIYINFFLLISYLILKFQ